MYELRKQQNLLVEKIQRLGEALVIENDPASKFKLEKQLENTQAELTDLRQQITSQDLYACLLRLGYQDQEVTFTRFVYRESVAAFLIHIHPDPENGWLYGQHWLLNRLKLRVLQGIAGKKVILDLTCLARSRDVKALWRELGRQVGLRQDSKPSEIADRVYQCWQTQNIFLILDSVDFMPEAYMQNLLQEFWSPLVARIQQAQKLTSSFKLLMFLIDKSGAVENWNIQFVDCPNPVWRSEIPVKLPWIQKFSSEVLTNWIFSEFPNLPQFIEDTEVAVETVLSNSENGVPQWVFQEICTLSNCEWRDEWDRL
ncbi:hypothetical protein LC593_10005 [Nostoc sp. CHAB 5844]|nr:hypothetical protein [Nostoc sp. CHAB 5844]